ncbi:menaquinol oxidoreductase [Geobacter argillaceus]|uniref:Menaquinol oxidoreductase n=1 Tax=Geobacter argillaceus TaxID=345631 RepID=A0A562WPZ0_9BACT|nr:menaquinol oxidoreductase [Geobacter argillaceus]TWJ32400.1 hypothetical protein JN12_00840 [Geobacter argillaceus]
MEQPDTFTTSQEHSQRTENQSTADRRAAIRENIKRLERRANHGLYILAIFITLSIVAVQNFSLLPSFPPAVLKALGKPPSAQMISAALLVYLFSAIILTLARMMEGTGKAGGFAHLGYLAAFYFFYHFSGNMDVHFWAVFAAGVTILSLESYHLWQHCREEILKERALLAELDSLTRKSRLHP